MLSSEIIRTPTTKVYSLDPEEGNISTRVVNHAK